MKASSQLNARQLYWARKIRDVIQSMSLPNDEGERACDIVYETVKQESDFQMYANKYNPESYNYPHDAEGDDHGSVGLFQQQVGGARNSTANWGTTRQCMDVVYSTTVFVQILRTKNAGSWKTKTNWQAAQMVQGSSFPDRYQKWDAFAIALRKELWDESQSKPDPLTEPVGKNIAVLAQEVMAGHWGNGVDRKKRLTKAGYNYDAVQEAVNTLLNGTSSKPGRAYKVQDGDTLTDIASRFGVRGGYKALAKFNAIDDPDKIYAGQIIQLP